MSTPAVLLNAPDDAQARIRWSELSDEDRAALLWQAEWLSKRKAYQIEPEGTWDIWAMICGRGTGKTRTGAEWTGRGAWLNPGSRSLVAAPTSGDVRDTCFEGESGLLAVIPKILVRNYTRSLHEIILVNDSLIKGIPTTEPERFRGPQWHRAWLDEVAAWDHGGGEDEEAWDMIEMAMRLGDHPQTLVTSTPKPRRVITRLIKQSKERNATVVITHATTHDNLDNLAPTFKRKILQYEGTQIGRQEIYGEVLDPESGGIIKRSSIRLWPAKTPLPVFDIIIMSLDTAFTDDTRDKRGNVDPTACAVWGGFVHKGKPGIMLLDAWEAFLEFPDLIERVKRERQARYGDDRDTPFIKPLVGPGRMATSGKGIDIIVIEDKGSGISLRQSLARDGIIAMPYNPGKADKLARLHIVSKLFAQGIVWVVESDKRPGEFRSWAEPLVAQVCSYAGEGTTEHDDYVDVTTQGLRVLDDTWLVRAMQPKTPTRAAREAVPVISRGRENPYAS